MYEIEFGYTMLGEMLTTGATYKEQKDKYLRGEKGD
jgi:hypothetical protein